MANAVSVVMEYSKRCGEYDLEAVMAMYDEDAVFFDCAGPTTLRGPDEISRIFVDQWAGLEDFRIDRIIHVLGQDRLVFMELELAATHTGEFLGCPPTNTEIRWATAGSWELTANDQISREGYYYDKTTLLAQLRGESS